MKINNAASFLGIFPGSTQALMVAALHTAKYSTGKTMLDNMIADNLEALPWAANWASMSEDAKDAAIVDSLLQSIRQLGVAGLPGGTAASTALTALKTAIAGDTAAKLLNPANGLLKWGLLAGGAYLLYRMFTKRGRR